MFNWKLVLILVAVSLPGILVSIPGLIKSTMGTMKNNLPEGKTLPPLPVMMVLSAIQSIILIAIFAAIGTWLNAKTGFDAPFFRAISEGKPAWQLLQPQLLPALLYGAGGALVLLAFYYGFYRPRLDRETVRAMEGLRMTLGISARVLYGGIVEEVLTRWGLLAIFTAVGQWITGGVSPAVVWGSIVLSGIIFGFGHMPSYLGAGCKRTPLFMSLMLLLNLWASLIFGWLFWQYGLAAAMVAHMTFHLVWYPLDLHFTREWRAEETA